MTAPPINRVLMGAVSGLLLLTGGCGGDEPAAGPGTRASTDAASTSASPTADASSSAAPAPAPSESTSPSSTYAGVAPADGPVLPGSIVSVHAPRGWSQPRLVEGSDIQTITGAKGDPRYGITLVDSTTSRSDTSLEALVADSRRSSAIDPPLARQPDVVLDGQPAYHLAGRDAVFQALNDEFGFYRGGHLVTITVAVPEDLAEPEREAITSSIVASLTVVG